MSFPPVVYALGTAALVTTALRLYMLTLVTCTNSIVTFMEIVCIIMSSITNQVCGNVVVMGLCVLGVEWGIFHMMTA